MNGLCPTHGSYRIARVGRAACPACRAERDQRAKPDTPARRIRSTRAWKRLRKLVVERDDGQCTFGTAPGEHYWTGRCPVIDGLDVHHIVAIDDGGAPFDERNLRTLCATHHRRLEHGR